MEFKGMMGGLYRFSEWIMRFSVTNLLWLLCSVPFLFATYMVLAASAHIEGALNFGDIISIFLLPAIVAPFTTFPATAAMFVLARKWVMDDADVPLLKTFFRGFKENYLKAMLGGLLFSFMLFVLLVDYRYFNGVTHGGLFYLFMVIFAVFAVIVVNFFSILAHFHMTFWQVVKNAVLLTIGRPITSLLILITNAVIFYFCLTKFNYFLAVFFMGSLAAYMSFWHFHRVFSKIMQKEEERKEAESSDDSTSVEASGEGDADKIFSDRPLIPGDEEEGASRDYEIDKDRFRKY